MDARFLKTVPDARAWAEACCDYLALDHPELYKAIRDMAKMKTILHEDAAKSWTLKEHTNGCEVP